MLPIDKVFLEYPIQTATQAQHVFDVMVDNLDVIQELYKTRPQDVSVRLIKLRAKAKGIKSEIDAFKREITSGKASDATNAMPFLRDTIEELPPDDVMAPHVLHKMRSPKGYRLLDDGIYKVTVDEFDEEVLTPIFDAPVIVAAESQSHQTDEQLLTLCYKAQGRWTINSFPSGDVLFGRGAVKLANKGIPVDGNNAKAFIKYIGAFRRYNKAVIPKHRISEQLGWYEDRYYILPHTVITPTGTEDPGVFFENPRNFANVGAIPPIMDLGGPLQIHAQQWVRALSVYPWLYIGLCAALSSHLVAPLTPYGAKSFTVDIGGRSGTGKTTMLDVMANTMGAPESYRVSWEKTNIYIQNAAGILGNSPLCLEELKRRIGKRGMNGIPGAQAIAYFVHDGEARSGMTSDLDFARQMSCKLVAGSSDEVGLLYRAKDAAGLRARLFPVMSPPTGIRSEQSRQQINLINDLGTKCTGYVGYAFIRYFVHYWAVPEWREAVVKKFQSSRDRYAVGASSSEVIRCANYAALIETAMWFFENALADENGPIFDQPACGRTAITEKMMEALRKVGDASNETENQILNLGAWLQSQPGNVLGLGDRTMPNAVYAIWPTYEQNHLLVTQSGLLRFMTFSDSGFDARNLINEWGAQGILMVPNKQQLELVKANQGDYYKFGLVKGRYPFTGPDGQTAHMDFVGWRVNWSMVGALFSMTDPNDVMTVDVARDVLENGV